MEQVDLDTSAESLTLSVILNDEKKTTIKKKKPVELKIDLKYENSESVDEEDKTQLTDMEDYENQHLDKGISNNREDKKQNLVRRKDHSLRKSTKLITKEKKGEKFVQSVNSNTFKKMTKFSEETTDFSILVTKNNTKTYCAREDDLIKKFAAIGIFLQVCQSPTEFNKFGRFGIRVDSETKSFMIDLERWKYYSFIKIFLGENNTINVKDFNTEFNQLVLAVQEPKRSFHTTRRVWDEKKGKMVNLKEETSTPAENRTILIGQDEGNPFMSLLPEHVNTVEEAHLSLMPEELKHVKKSKFVRQGEWFFVETQKFLPKSSVKTGEGLSNGKGRPHKVGKIIKLGEEENDEVYIKGHVSHPDHHNLHFSNWARVYKNRELILDTIKGVTWID